MEGSIASTFTDHGEVNSLQGQIDPPAMAATVQVHRGGRLLLSTQFIPDWPRFL